MVVVVVVMMMTSNTAWLDREEGDHVLCDAVLPPRQQWCTLSIPDITNFIMEGGSCHCVQWAEWIYTLSPPSEQQQQHCPLSVRHLATALAPFWRCCGIELIFCFLFFGRIGLFAIRPPARTWGDVKESIWMNKWCRPSARRRRGLAGEGSLKMHPFQAPLPHLRARQENTVQMLYKTQRHSQGISHDTAHCL